MRLLICFLSAVSILVSGCEHERTWPTKQTEDITQQHKVQELLAQLSIEDPNWARITASLAKRKEDALKYPIAGPVEINDSLIGLTRTQVLEKIGLSVTSGCSTTQAAENIELMLYRNKKALDLPPEQISYEIKLVPVVLLDDKVVAYGWDAFDKYSEGTSLAEVKKILILLDIIGSVCK